LKSFKDYLEIISEGNRGKGVIPNPSSIGRNSFKNENIIKKENINKLSQVHEKVNDAFKKILSNNKDSGFLKFFLSYVFPDIDVNNLSNIDDLFKIKFEHINKKGQVEYITNLDEMKDLDLDLKTLNLLKLLKFYKIEIKYTDESNVSKNVLYVLPNEIIKYIPDNNIAKFIASEIK
jgi:hypothetical protein